VDAIKIDSFPRADTPVVSVITVTFNSAADISRCLASVVSNGNDIPLEHIVIDNASRDDTARIVTTGFPQVVFVANAVNRGLTQANNQGRDIARGRFIVFLNPDTIVPDGTFRRMAEIMDHEPALGVLAPRLVDERGRFTPGIMGHRAPTAWTLTNGFLLLSRLSQLPSGCRGASGSDRSTSSSINPATSSSGVASIASGASGSSRSSGSIPRGKSSNVFFTATS